MERVAVLLVLLVSAVTASDMSRGWGDDINWLNNIEAAKTEAAKDNKPIMVLIHKTWCGACKALKPQVSTSQQITDKSKDFVMVNLQDDEDKGEFVIDGGYIPRIFFLDSTGKVHEEIYNKGGSQQYKYFYSSPDSIIKSMDEALKVIGGTDTKEKREL